MQSKTAGILPLERNTSENHRIEIQMETSSH